MKTASITHTKNKLSALIDEVKRGETVLILDRGRPVARLVPAVMLEEPEELSGRVERLERAGVIRRGEGTKEPRIGTPPPARPSASPSAVRALLTNREGG